MPNKIIILTAHLPFKIKKRSKWFVSSCPILDIYSQGRTEQEAIKNLEEALSLFFISCLEIGTLDQILKNCGFIVAKSDEDITEPSTEDNYLNVPIPLLWNNERFAQCHA